MLTFSVLVLRCEPHVRSSDLIQTNAVNEIIASLFLQRGKSAVFLRKHIFTLLPWEAPERIISVTPKLFSAAKRNIWNELQVSILLIGQHTDPMRISAVKNRAQQIVHRFLFLSPPRLAKQDW